MQRRMKENPLSAEEITQLLAVSAVGSFSTLLPNGYPYTIPIHFVYYNGNIYMHGLPKGQKLDNIALNNKVCFEIFQMDGLLVDGVETPCDVNTVYQSVVILGDAFVVIDLDEKRLILKEIIKKYTPELVQMEMPEKMVAGTCVTRITPQEMTGKYYK